MYPKIPSKKIAYDVNGSSVLFLRDDTLGGGWVDAHPDSVKALNGTKSGGMHVTTTTTSNTPGPVWNGHKTSGLIGTMGIILPVPHDLEGYFFYAWQRVHSNTFGSEVNWRLTTPQVLISPDTTNLVDGRWFTPPASFASAELAGFPGKTQWNNLELVPNTESVDSYTGLIRSDRALSARAEANLSPVSVTMLNVRGIKLMFPNVVNYYGQIGYNHINMLLNLYGVPSTSLSGVLKFVSETTDTSIPKEYMSIGLKRPGDSVERRVRLKNTSTTETVDAVRVGIEFEPFTASSVSASSFSLSMDGSSWSPTVDLPSLAPGEVSPVIRVRGLIDSNAELGPHGAWVRVLEESWSA